MLKRKEEEVAEAEVLRDSMLREVNEVKRELARIGKCISDVERNLSTAKSSILKSKAQLKKKEQDSEPSEVPLGVVTSGHLLRSGSKRHF